MAYENNDSKLALMKFLLKLVSLLFYGTKKCKITF